MRRSFFRHQAAVAGWAGPPLLSPSADPYYVGLEQALQDSFKREAQVAAARLANMAGISAVAYLRSKGGRAAVVPYVGDDWISQESSPLRQWWDRITKIEENFGRWEFAAILIFDRRYQPSQPHFHAYALSPAIVGPLRDLETKVGVWPKENEMHTYGDYVGAATGGGYPEIASRAVRDASQQSSSQAYGYFRVPVDGVSHQRVYLFNTLDEARGWLTALVHSAAQPYDYAAVFAPPDLSQPVPGLESFGHTMVGGLTQVGNVLPFLLGLPLGALGGYFYRGWRDQHPGQWIPGLPAASDRSPQVSGGPWLDVVGPQVGVGGPWLDVNQMSGNQPYVGGPWLDVMGPQVGGPWLDVMGPQVGGSWLDIMGPQVGGPWLDVDGMFGNQPYVGGPWLDVDDMSGQVPYVGGPWLDLAGPQVGGPWVDLMGAEMDERERRRAWQHTQALIESAKRDVIDAQARFSAAAWVWIFDMSEVLPGSRVTDLYTTQITPFSSIAQAQAYIHEQSRIPHIALGLFDTRSSRIQPTLVMWHKSDDPAYEALIDQRVAEYASPRTAGDYGGRRTTSIGSALSDVRDRAQSIATKRSGDVVGVFHATKDQLWHALAFANEDDANDWLETQDPVSFTYAAYFDKNDATWPRAVLEKIGGFRSPVKARASIGQATDGIREQAKIFAYAKALATGTQGNAVGVVHLVDGSWSTSSFGSLDDAIDWLGRLTAHKERYTYAGAFDKASDGTAYVQQEEFGGPPTGNPRSIAATSGGYSWRAA